MRPSITIFLQYQLQHAVDDGMITTNSALVKRFARELVENRELANKYSDAQSHKAKAAFRQRWATMKLAEVKEQGKSAATGIQHH